MLIAFGPTREALDEVRYISNRSSGRMGAALAESFARRGCQVTAVVGPGAIRPVGVARCEEYLSAADLLGRLQAEWPAHDLLIMAAAVADFRPVDTFAGKLRREAGPLRLELEPTPDILAGLAGATRADQYVVGFALERQEELEASATSKLSRKRVDAVVANPLETMDAPEVRARVLLSVGGWIAPPGEAAISKQAFAEWFSGVIAPLAEQRRSGSAG